MTREELKAIRTGLGLSQRELARRVGVVAKTIARWEAGIHPIGLVYERLIRIVAATPRPAPPEAKKDDA